MSEVAVSDTVEIHDSVTIKTTVPYSDTVNILDSITIKTTTPYTDIVNILDSVAVRTTTPYTDILRIHDTLTVERIRDGEVVESRVITYPERVTVMNLDLLFNALALTVREVAVKMGENARDIGIVFLAGTFGVETIKMTKDIKLMLRRAIEDMIRAMK